MITFHILDDDHNVVATTFELWMEWWGQREAHVQVDRTMVGDILIDTTFLSASYPPTTPFETMVFGGEYDLYQVRCSTWDDAILQHAEAVKLVTK